MSDDVLLRDLAAEVGGADRALALLDRVQAKPAEDVLGRLVIAPTVALAVREAAREEDAEGV